MRERKIPELRLRARNSNMCPHPRSSGERAGRKLSMGRVINGSLFPEMYVLTSGPMREESGENEIPEGLMQRKLYRKPTGYPEWKRTRRGSFPDDDGPSLDNSKSGRFSVVAAAASVGHLSSECECTHARVYRSGYRCHRGWQWESFQIHADAKPRPSQSIQMAY